MAEINKGVGMLLARMESHPKEFDKNVTTGRFGRWTFAIDDVLKSDCFTEEEKELVSNKLREVKRGRFTEEVMKELLGENGVATAHVNYKYVTPSFAKDTK